MKNTPAVLVLAVVAGCAATPPATPLAPAADALIALERGGCGYIAACPAYRIEMKPGGGWRYEGFRNVPVTGVREGQLAEGAWDKAEAAFVKAGWSTLQDPVTREGGVPCMSDSPVARITRRVTAGDEKVFTYNLGCSSPAGSALLDAIGELLPVPAS